MTFHLMPALWLLSLIPSISAKCKTFDPQYQGGNILNYVFSTIERSFVASAVVNCSTVPGETTPGVFFGNESSDCASNQCYLSVPPDWYIRLNRTLSIAVDATTEQDIFDLVVPEFGIVRSKTDFNATKIWATTQASTCINETNAAYWEFTPYYSCIEGNLTGCDQGGSPAEGTFIRACGVRFLPAVPALADGVLSVVQTSGVDSQPAPPNATEIVATNTASRGLYAGFGVVLPFVVGLAICLNLGL